MDKAIKEILKSTGIKLAVLLSISVPLSALVAFIDKVSFFGTMKIMGIIFVFMGIAAFLPSERAAINITRNPNILLEDKYYAKGKKPYYERMLKGNIVVFSKGAVQVIISAIIILGVAFLLD